MKKKIRYAALPEEELAKAVYDALLKRALGYTIPERTTVRGKKGEVTTTTVSRHIPADPQACAFILNKYDPKNWPVSWKEATRGFPC